MGKEFGLGMGGVVFRKGSGQAVPQQDSRHWGILRDPGKP